MEPPTEVCSIPRTEDDDVGHEFSRRCFEALPALAAAVATTFAVAFAAAFAVAKAVQKKDKRP